LYVPTKQIACQSLDALLMFVDQTLIHTRRPSGMRTKFRRLRIFVSGLDLSHYRHSAVRNKNSRVFDWHDDSSYRLSKNPDFGQGARQIFGRPQATGLETANVYIRHKIPHFCFPLPQICTLMEIPQAPWKIAENRTLKSGYQRSLNGSRGIAQSGDRKTLLGPMVLISSDDRLPSPA
jgi:hypothetical protein